jgi:hypothetical protein
VFSLYAAVDFVEHIFPVFSFSEGGVCTEFCYSGGVINPLFEKEGQGEIFSNPRPAHHRANPSQSPFCQVF